MIIQSDRNKYKKDFFQPDEIYHRKILPKLNTNYYDTNNANYEAVSDFSNSTKNNQIFKDNKTDQASSNQNMAINLNHSNSNYSLIKNNKNYNQFLTGNPGIDKYIIKDINSRKINGYYMENKQNYQSESVSNYTMSSNNFENVTSIHTQETKTNNKLIKPIPLNLQNINNNNINNNDNISSEGGYSINGDNNDGQQVIELPTSVRTKTSQEESEINDEGKKININKNNNNNDTFSQIN